MNKPCAVTAPFPGVTQWLRHGEQVGLWDLRVLGPEPTEIPDAPLYMFGAWHPAYGPIVTRIRRELPKARIVIAWSSSPGEMDDAQIEIIDTLALTKGGPDIPKIDAWACLHPDMVDHLPDSVHLPAPIHIPTSHRPPPWSDETRNGIGFFAPATPKKNIYTQLLAVKSFQRKHHGPAAELHTNLENYRPIIDGLGIRATYYPWLERSRLEEVLGKMRVAMFCSTKESFGYGAVDALMQNTPVVTSQTCQWLPPDWRVLNANSPTAIDYTLERLWRYPGNDPYLWLELTAARNNLDAKAAIDSLMHTAAEPPKPLTEPPGLT